jgi:hypothetical protein
MKNKAMQVSCRGKFTASSFVDYSGVLSIGGKLIILAVQVSVK